MNSTRTWQCRPQNHPVPLSSNSYIQDVSSHIRFTYNLQRNVLLQYSYSKGVKFCGNWSLHLASVHRKTHARNCYVSAWDDKPFEVLPTGKRAYLDEQDVVTFLDPPKELIPLEPGSYNPAAYLWKKIEEIPEARRQRLLDLLKPRLISRAWQIACTRYEDPKLNKKITSKLFDKVEGQLEYYSCRSSGGPMPIAFMNFFKMAIFSCKDGKAYGRLIGESFVASIANYFSPLYFMVTQIKEVMPTAQPCDFAYEFGEGLFDIHEFPNGFPKPAKHPYPISDQVVIYIRHLGPGVSVGQAWQEGKALEQIPRKLCGEILMVKDYRALC